MSEKDDGGQAFPGSYPGLDQRVSGWVGGGLTMRDYFAVQALPAIIALYVEANGRCIGSEHFPRNVPHIAYTMADAMLEARKA